MTNQNVDIEAVVLAAIQCINIAREPSDQIPEVPDAPLYGDGGPLDSLGLVALLMEVEEGLRDQGLDVVLTNEKLRKQFDANTPMKRPGTVEDIAAAALYLASPASAWVTGKIFQIDGGTECPSISVPVEPL